MRCHSYVAVSHILPNLNEELFPGATEFSPERHLECQFDEYQLTTFSHGLHKCPGERLATVLIRLVVGSILRKFDVAAPGGIPPLSFDRATLAQRAGPCWATFSPV